jgi:hypothetical protein|tara:strand:- start:7 stop:198 length:192 start_codon:yes stop_codon:yes gene_type:complete
LAGDIFPAERKYQNSQVIQIINGEFSRQIDHLKNNLAAGIGKLFPTAIGQISCYGFHAHRRGV